MRAFDHSLHEVAVVVVVVFVVEGVKVEVEEVRGGADGEDCGE